VLGDEGGFETSEITLFVTVGAGVPETGAREHIDKPISLVPTEFEQKGPARMQEASACSHNLDKNLYAVWSTVQRVARLILAYISWQKVKSACWHVRSYGNDDIETSP
jgi:hypothetical protein